MVEGNYLYLGGPFTRGDNYPRYLGVSVGEYPNGSRQTSSTPVSIEFTLDTSDATGRFEIEYIANGVGYRLLVKSPNGAWQATTMTAIKTVPANGSMYRDLFTLGAPGVYQLRLEFGGSIQFNGIRTLPTDGVRAARHKKLRYIVVGDSFTEPTIVGPGPIFNQNGWVQQLAHLTGYDMWSAGAGGTGYMGVPENNLFNRVKFSERLRRDILSNKADGVIFAGGINDMGFDVDAVYSEACKCFAEVRDDGRDLVVLSPFWPRNAESFPYSAWQHYDAIKKAAEEYQAQFIDLLDLGVPDYIGEFETTVSSAYNNGSHLYVRDIPSFFKSATAGTDHWFIRVGSGNNQGVVEVTSIGGATGSGPYDLSLKTPLLSSFPAGTKAKVCGHSYMTGTGGVYDPKNDGNADRYTGQLSPLDTTHPTMLGAPHIARTVAWRWSELINSR